MGCSRNDIYNFNFAQNPDDDFDDGAKSNGTGLSVHLKICNIDAVNNLDDKVAPVSVKLTIKMFLKPLIRMMPIRNLKHSLHLIMV